MEGEKGIGKTWLSITCLPKMPIATGPVRPRYPLRGKMRRAKEGRRNPPPDECVIRLIFDAIAAMLNIRSESAFHGQ
jgi:hypothetical protein